MKCKVYRMQNIKWVMKNLKYDVWGATAVAAIGAIAMEIMYRNLEYIYVYLWKYKYIYNIYIYILDIDFI